METGLTKAIGAPEDYNKNLDKGNFPMNTDLRIPGRRQSEEAGSIEDALEGIELSDKSDSKTKIPIMNAEADQFMPIKAIN